jgi:hypothetical protein
MKSGSPFAVASEQPLLRILQFALDHFEPHISEKSAWSTTAKANVILSASAVP